MSSFLTVAGAVFEVVGLAVVFIELAVIRSHEFDVPTPWARLGAGWLEVDLTKLERAMRTWGCYVLPVRRQ